MSSARERLCLACGTVLGHASDCPHATPSTRVPGEREGRVRVAIQEAGERLGEIEALVASDPRKALLLALAAEEILSQHPASDLASFEDKRAHNALETKLAKCRVELAQALPDERGARLVADFPFARRAIELLFQLALRRANAWDFDVQALASLPTPIKAASDSGAALKDICAEVDARAKASGDLDREVESWGWANLRPLMGGDEPFHYPDHVIKKGMTRRLGALVGLGGGSRQTDARDRFKQLSVRFRERLYLLGANAILWRVTSRLAQAEEAWKRHTPRDDAKRWSRIEKEDPDLLRFFLGPDVDLASGVEKALTRLVRTAPALMRGALREFADLTAEEWDVFARAYFFERAAVLDDSASSELGLEPVARALIERRRDVPVDTKEVAALVDEVRKMWSQKPPREAREK